MTTHPQRISRDRLAFLDTRFPFTVGTNRTTNGWETIFHCHPGAVEMQYIHSGSGSYFIRDRIHPYAAKSLFILHENDVHAYIREQPTAEIKTYLGFHNAFFKTFPPDVQPAIRRLTACSAHFPHRIQLTDTEALHLEFWIHLLETEYRNQPPAYQAMIRGGLSAIFVMLDRALTRPRDPPVVRDRSLIQAAVGYIDQHYQEALTLPLVARRLGYSPYHISHLFHKQTGLNFKACLNSRRVMAAKQMIEHQPQTKLTALALEAGFSDLSTFNRQFKRVTGFTPSHYRKICLTIRK